MFNTFIHAPNGAKTHTLREVDGDFRRYQIWQVIQDLPGIILAEQKPGNPAVCGTLRIVFDGDRDILASYIEEAKWGYRDDDGPAAWRRNLEAALAATQQ